MTLLAAASEPDWWARGIAAASFIVAVCGLGLSWRVYQRGGARVSISLVDVRRFHIFRIHQGIWLPVRIRNRGLAAVEVSSCTWEVQGGDPSLGRRGLHRLRSTRPNDDEGKPVRLPAVFPVTVEGQHSFTWMTQPPAWNERETGKSAYRMRLRATLGSGLVVASSWVIVNQEVDWDEIQELAGWRRVI